VVQVGGGNTASVTVQNDGAGPVEFIMDVNGYFE
jgi:rhamnose utilization protein RhaD (predicted bifunctional aldolase and dehydrogenase)